MLSIKENFSFEVFREIQFQKHFMKHEILSWNTLTLVSKFHCASFSSMKKCVYIEKIYAGSGNLIALIVINNISYYKSKTNKNSKRSQRIWNKAWSKNMNEKSAWVNIFSELLLRYYANFNFWKLQNMFESY